jgi:hypothetical protein
MTSWHIGEDLLRRYVSQTDSVDEGALVEQHLLACADCRARVGAAADVIDLAAAWDRTRDLLELPTPSRFERLLQRVGLPAHEARLVAVATAFRGVWLVGAAAALAFAGLAAAVGRGAGGWLFLAVAPIVPCLVVAAGYDPWLDPALEPELATSYPALRLILLRTMAVLALALPTMLLIGLFVPGPAPFAWLLPAVGFVAVVLAASTWISPLLAAVAVSSGWFGLIWVLATSSGSPESVVLRSPLQASFLALSVSGVVILLLRQRRLCELGAWR